MKKIRGKIKCALKPIDIDTGKERVFLISDQSKTPDRPKKNEVLCYTMRPTGIPVLMNVYDLDLEHRKEEAKAVMFRNGVNIIQCQKCGLWFFQGISQGFRRRDALTCGSNCKAAEYYEKTMSAVEEESNENG